MTDFDEKLSRLKQVLAVREDQEAAAALGMSKAALSDRKRRDAFPDDKVAALAASRRPGSIDVDYILTGQGHTIVQGVAETRARYNDSGPWARNLLVSYGLPKDDAMCEPLRGVDTAADGSPRIRNAMASVIDVYAKRCRQVKK